MKKVLKRLKLHSVLAGFMLVGAFVFGATRAEAQAAANMDLNDTQGLNWVTEGDAIAILTANVEQYAIDLGNYIPGSMPYNNALYHLNYYKLVMSDIESGTQVPAAVTHNLNSTIYGANGNTDATGTNKAWTSLLYTDIVGLLTI